MLQELTHTMKTWALDRSVDSITGEAGKWARGR